MKQLLITFVFITLISPIFAQAAFNWVASAGGNDLDNNFAIAVDDSGNSYITGNFLDTASFGTTSLTSYGEQDIYIAKLDANGNWLWAVQAGGTLADNGYGIAVDEIGNVYVTGYFYGTARFGNTFLFANGGAWNDVFIVKLDTNGNWLWAKRAGGTNFDTGYGIDTDSAGNCYVTGSFTFTADFGTTSLTSAGSSDLFVTKLDTNGNWNWAKRAGGSSPDLGQDIAIDLNDNIFITGYFSTNASFGALTLTSNGDRDIMAVKMDTDGNWIWATGAGGTVWDMGQRISTDGSGNIYITGYFKDTVVFGSSTISSGATYNQDIFVAKLNPSGNWQWAVGAGGYGTDYGYGIAADLYGFVYITGGFDAAAYFGMEYLTSEGINDIFIAGLDSNSNWLWVKAAGGISLDYGRDVCVDAQRNIRVSGDFRHYAFFDDLTLSSAGDADYFVTKLSVPALPLLSLPFLEDWYSGSLYSNYWTADSDNWHIDNTLGNPAPAVVFQSTPGLMDYDSSLTSHEFDGTGISSVKLKFNIDYDYTDWMGYNTLTVEIWNGVIWSTIGTYSYVNVYELTTVIMDISSYAVGNIFKIRFRAQGSDGSTFNYWLIDNIRLEEIPTQISTPQNLTMTKSGNFVYLNWDPVPEADWYGLYIAFDAYGPFYYGNWVEASITQLEGEITPDMDPMLFFRITAGAGDPPEFRNPEQNSLEAAIKTLRSRQ